MSKTFRPWSLDQALLLPPSVHDFVPAGHLSRFVVALVTEELDLSAILASYKGEKGQPPYHPAMMVALLLYAYAVGIYSSRRIAKACIERPAEMSPDEIQKAIADAVAKVAADNAAGGGRINCCSPCAAMA
jgi:hypothetical protein